MTFSSSFNVRFGGYIDSVTNVEALRNYPTFKLSDGDVVIVTGNIEPADGDGGFYTWLEAATDPDDGLIVVKPNDSSSGRWKMSAGRGPKGDTGEQGEKGDQGPQGVQGVTGPVGPQAAISYASVSDTDAATANNLAVTPASLINYKTAISNLQSTSSTGGTLYYSSWSSLNSAFATYNGATTYSLNQTAVNQGIAWIYIGASASAGNAPPTLPTTSNAYWSVFRNPLVGQAAAVSTADSGTHTDPTTGTTVNNTGVFTWTTGTSGTGWKYLFATDAALAQTSATAASASASAAAASAASVSAVAATLNPTVWGSVRFPSENGEDKNSTDNGLIYLPNSGNLTTAAAFANGDFTAMIFWDMPLEAYRAINRAPVLFGTYIQSTAGLNRSFTLTYCSPAWGGGPTYANRFVFNIRGETGASANWQAVSDPIPAGFSGRACVVVRRISNNISIDFWDCQTLTKTAASTPVAMPSGFVGVQALTYNLGIGGSRPDVFPADDTTGAPLNTQNVIPNARGSFRDLLMVDDDLTDTQIISIINGSDPVTTATSALTRLYCPLVSNGTLSLAVTSNQAALSSATLTQLGNLYAGPHLKPQSDTKYLTIDRVPYPGFVGREVNAESAPWIITGKFAGLSGQLEFQFIDSSNKVIKPWHRATVSLGSGTWSALAELPRTNMRFQIQVRMSSDPTVIGVTHQYIYVGPVVHIWGQSETVYSTVGISSTASKLGTLTTLATKPSCDISSVIFNTIERGAGAGTITGQWRPGLLTDAGVTIANYIRQRTPEPVMIVVQAVGGTKMGALVNDADTTRNWSDALAMASIVVNKDANGAYPAAVHVIGGWEYSDGQIDIVNQNLLPLIQGIGSATIPQSSINHYLYNGEFSNSAKLVVLPNNRQLSAVSAQTSDRSTEADQRDNYRNAAKYLGAILGPETTLAKMLMSSPYTHPLPADPEGDVEMARAFAEAACLGLGIGSYKGVSLFTSASWVSGSGNTQIDLTLSDPQPIPGTTPIAPVNPAGNKLGPKVAASPIYGFEAKLNSGGNFSISNVAGATVINPRLVRVTLATAGTVGQTQIAYHSGGPGDYGTALSDDLFRHGGLVANGFPVGGSNVAFTL
ncbi:collagen-like protein [Flavisphingomonas formosensis]|uniref:collagen-like protein n=1 Tax=Flavisphingomonas formosensis TaxID=861534 RepID=UPI0012FADCD8|nr:collagen-like protein [Sphingomonas formosensis]